MVNLFRWTKVTAGDPAPDFSLPNQERKEIRLSAFRGKKSVLLSFYPMDFTPG